MTTTENQLWEKIARFDLDDGEASFQFSKRLARENGWKLNFSKQVIEEYKKFIFLCCITENGVTPSDQVDQAWHLHLSYTKSYWIDLCKNILEKEIHHNPTKGGVSEAQKFNGHYSDTLNLYKQKFGIDAPASIWPENEERFSDIHFQRVNIRKFWLIRKPRLKRNSLELVVLLLLGTLSIQSANFSLTVFFGALAFGWVIWYFFNQNNNSGCSSGGSDSNINSDHHSGCNGDSGCSASGCSGCGSGCSGD